MYAYNRISRILIVFLLLLGIGALTGCEGPQGPKGAEGPQGEVGPIGPAGEDGSKMYAGTGAPTSNIGSKGDYYLDTNTGEYYGPKDSNGWGNPIIILMGDDGKDGKDGSQIYSGSGTPDSSLGQEGDYYLDKSNHDLYGPKTASGWDSPINIKGADGNANVTLYVFNAADYTSGSPSNTVSISGFSRENVLTSQWEFAFTRGRFMQFIPGKTDFGGSSLSEFTVELFYTTSGDAEFTIELINGSDYYPDNLLIFKTEPTTVNGPSANLQEKPFELPSPKLQHKRAKLLNSILAQ